MREQNAPSRTIANRVIAVERVKCTNLSPSHSCSWNSPAVVFRGKLGKTSPRRNAMSVVSKKKVSVSGMKEVNGLLVEEKVIYEGCLSCAFSAFAQERERKTFAISMYSSLFVKQRDERKGVVRGLRTLTLDRRRRVVFSSQWIEKSPSDRSSFVSNWLEQRIPD